jgi:hypothetical protein
VGGLGSGARRTRLAVEECRSLEIGELCAARGRPSEVHGEVHWRAKYDGELLARLSYTITGRENPPSEFLLAYSYWPEGPGGYCEDQLVLESLPGRRCYAFCPRCGRRVLSLYAPSGAPRFYCRSCWGLVYRPSQESESLAYVAEVAGPTMRELAALPRRVRRRPRRHYVAGPPAKLARRLAEELPLGDEELRLWCLRLRGAGLSYRQIAALVESSKSSVARYCTAGRAGLETMALVRERLERDAGPAAPQGDGPRELAAYLGALHRRALRLGLYRHPITETEERLVIAADPALEP